MPWPDLVGIGAIAALTSLIVGALAVGILRLAKRASLIVQLCILVVAAIVSVVVSMIGVANAMYLSEHDLTVAVTVAALSGAVSLVLSALLGWMVVRNSRTLFDAARRIGAGERVSSAGPQSASELTALADELVRTSQKLAESREREAKVEASRRELVAWISHDLRTPLAGIRAMSEALEDGLAADPDRYHRQMRSQVDQLSLLVDDLFELSKIDSGTLRLNLEEVSLYDIVSDTVADLQTLAAGRQIVIDPPGRTDILVRVDPRELSRAVGNLLVNAIEHTPAGSSITVSAHVVDGQAAVTVVDEGGGIADDDLERVFEPGWRGASARTPAVAAPNPAPPRASEPLASSGAGLGLAIVRGIVRAHDGEVRVRNVPGGCRFDVLLPH